MYDKKRNHKKIKKRRSFRAVFLTALICAAVSVLVIVGALWFVFGLVLTLFEAFVAFLQAYVFAILSTVYISMSYPEE